MDEIRAARLALKWQSQNEWPGTRCACGEEGATDLGHIVYTRHPDSIELYHPYNMTLLHNHCNTTQEALWINVNACLILLERAGSPEKWLGWARSISRKGKFWYPDKMQLAIDMWNQGIRPFELDRIKATLVILDRLLREHYDNRPLGGEGREE